MRPYAAILVAVGMVVTAAFAQQDDDAGEADASAEAAMEPAGAIDAVPATAPIDEAFDGADASNIKERIERAYDENVAYENPYGQFQGRAALVQHYGKLFENVASLAFEVREEFVSGGETVALWSATLAHKDLRSGEPIAFDGVSHIKLKDGKVIWQRDYYDLGGLVYENTTFVGMLVRWVKGKMLPG